MLDGSDAHIADIHNQGIYWRYGLTAKRAFIDSENINELLVNGGMVGEVGLLSIDIDGNDYWVWKSIDVVNPCIVVIEYNAVFGDLNALTVPYRSDFNRTLAHHSNLYFGASLPALIELGKQKSYTFIGTNKNGSNAFFIRDDLAPQITTAISNTWAYPSNIREASDKNGDLSFIDGKDRARVIAHLPIINTMTDEKLSLMDIEKIYSEEWIISQPRLMVMQQEQDRN